MSISPEEVAKIAALARLDLAEETVTLFTEQLGDVLNYMEQLNSLDTSSVEPMYSPSPNEAVARPDVVKKDISREEILSNAPEADGSFFIVPKIV